MSFASGLINSLANPSYTQGLFNLGQQVGGMPARREAAQFDTEATKTQYQGEAAAEQGDIAALSQRKQQLIGMLDSAPNEEARTNLKKAIEELNGMTASTQQLAQQNKIDSVIEMERAIEDENIPMAARQAFVDRMEVLNGDPDVRAGVAKKKRDTKYAAIQSRFEMNKAKLNEEVSQLDLAGYGTEQFEQVSANVSPGAVRLAEEKALKREALVADYVEQINDRTWNDDKAQKLRDAGYTVSGDKVNDNNIWRALVKADFNNALSEMENEAGPIDEEKAESLVKFTLEAIAEAGDVPFEAPWADDIEESIMEVMTPEDKSALAALVKGQSAGVAVQTIYEFLKEKFPDAWKKSERLLMKNNAEMRILETLRKNKLIDNDENRRQVNQAFKDKGLI